ncbi:hypothetical protein ACTXIU_13360 [Glutamicibacter arilaitensis]|uniref:hypothetical protein n=1 Tax=Glutamicibacter arilaitensis TaxID=256701 RepID=UPI003FCFA1C3
MAKKENKLKRNRRKRVDKQLNLLGEKDGVQPGFEELVVATEFEKAEFTNAAAAIASVIAVISIGLSWEGINGFFAVLAIGVVPIYFLLQWIMAFFGYKQTSANQAAIVIYQHRLANPVDTVPDASTRKISVTETLLISTMVTALCLANILGKSKNTKLESVKTSSQ